ncbi:MAG: acyl carrier protein [Clostridia bacterium]|nr:acyl carrier protein [Clostridia bacterium]
MVFERIREIVCDQFDIKEEDITMESTLDDLDIDSIDAVDLAMDIEEEFDTEIPDEVLENMKTLGDVVRFIEDNA